MSRTYNPDLQSTEIWLDTATRTNVMDICSGYSSTAQSLCNEPSVAMYRVCEHVQKTTPLILQRKNTTAQAAQQGAERASDSDFALEAVQEMKKIVVFAELREQLLECAAELSKMARE
eukprot:NODE_5778_length_638_cov_27.660441_g5386_i0.p1 GENE.NODE_5778_length_638_cov_27.660441_g5386_i0~~NODE_5778_length_638_cov_27.660441_g5386_i0.p1  ORF type:complete len:118 (-),score=29.42 NODE_5778_length_638_cov_27.660441_g5386_i0:121-474(-)